jgi:hypothetical protein
MLKAKSRNVATNYGMEAQKDNIAADYITDIDRRASDCAKPARYRECRNAKVLGHMMLTREVADEISAHPASYGRRYFVC